MVFNLLPIPPLDGGRVLGGLLPKAGSDFLARIEPFGFIIVLLLVFGPVRACGTSSSRSSASFSISFTQPQDSLN